MPDTIVAPFADAAPPDNPDAAPAPPPDLSYLSKGRYGARTEGELRAIRQAAQNPRKAITRGRRDAPKDAPGVQDAKRRAIQRHTFLGRGVGRRTMPRYAASTTAALHLTLLLLYPLFTLSPFYSSATMRSVRDFE